MNCSKCTTPLSGFTGGCSACGHDGRTIFPAKAKVGALLFAAAAMLLLQGLSDHAKDLGSSRNQHSNRLERLPQLQKSQAFAKLLHDAGEACPAVTRTLFRGDIGTNAFWNIRCSDGGQWMISIADNSWTRVTNCARLTQAGTPCWTRL